MSDHLRLADAQRRVQKAEAKLAAVLAWQRGDFVGYVEALGQFESWHGETHGIVHVLEHHGATLSYCDDPHAPLFERAIFRDRVQFRPDRAGRPYALNARLDRPLPAEFIALLRSKWIGGMSIHYDEFAWVLAVLRNSGMTLSEPHELEHLAAMPETITVFRGFHVDPHAGDFDAALRGFSWSIDRATARSFGPDQIGGTAWTDHAGYLARAVVSKHAVHSFSAVEHEALIDRPDLIPVEAIEIVETQPVDRARAA